ncbi:hypothetical protein Cgig2_001072 [Carnegiea gigantea]|uniref:Uncharacterized protein n=1 Tax=Carnegiea gigantea TaxID=171969 RepID=A0A9Q1QC35_9CARY|nr:hypothetical protein Cgig2_001072 [Carnegiea gigantea]
MEETVKALMEEQRCWIQQQISEQNQKIEMQQQQMLAQMLNQLQIQEEKIHNNIGSGTEMGTRSNLHFNRKVEFPTFDGTGPKGWIKKCTRYFSLCRTGDEQKVDLAALHLKGPAEVWFGSYILGRRNIAWEEFIVDFARRGGKASGSRCQEHPGIPYFSIPGTTNASTRCAKLSISRLGTTLFNMNPLESCLWKKVLYPGTSCKLAAYGQGRHKQPILDLRQNLQPTIPILVNLALEPTIKGEIDSLDRKKTCGDPTGSQTPQLVILFESKTRRLVLFERTAKASRTNSKAAIAPGTSPLIPSKRAMSVSYCAIT